MIGLILFVCVAIYVVLAFGVFIYIASVMDDCRDIIEQNRVLIESIKKDMSKGATSND